MNLGDFSSLVQLGVGIHATTAILQLLVEFKTNPLSRRILRAANYLKTLKENQITEDDKLDVSDRILSVNGALDIFSINYFREYVWLVLANFGVAVFLFILLIYISFNFDNDIHYLYAIALSAFCFLPALVFYLILYARSGTAMSPIRRDIERIETILKLPRPNAHRLLELPGWLRIK